MTAIHNEAGASGYDLNDPKIRTLAQKPYGTISYSNLQGKSSYIDQLYTFTTSSSSPVTIPTGMNYAQFVIVAGGGGGGQSDNLHNFLDGGGGGGAGGVAISPKIAVTPGDKISFTVGAGGTGGITGQGTNGSNTSVTVNSTTYTVYGGGGGGGSISGTGQHLQPGKSGGSGGGSNGTNVGIDTAIPGRTQFGTSGIYYVDGGTSTQGSASGWTLFGNKGGPSLDNGLNGGGGGAGGVGNYIPNDTNVVPMQHDPTGGVGINPSAYGFPVSIPNTYVGGGGGAGGSGLPNIIDDSSNAFPTYTLNNVNTYNFRSGGYGGGGTGGIGIIGASGTAYGYAGGAGSDNTGGGGGGAGGGRTFNGYGGNGGSGVIYIYGTSK